MLVVEAMGDNPAAPREVWRFLLGIDLTERVEAELLDPALACTLPSRIRGGCG